jgi:hypothetical protein
MKIELLLIIPYKIVKKTNYLKLFTHIMYG